MKSYSGCQYPHHLFYDCETFINGPQPTTEAKLQGALAILPLLAGRAAVLFMTPLKLRKFQLYTIINFLRYFYKLRSRNKVGMDDDARSR